MGAVAQLKNSKDDNIQTRKVIITPHQATKWLEGNTHNRSMRDNVIHRFAADMKAGRWKLTHQGIAFDEDGTLIDGQHRLFAILEANVDVKMMVTTGLPMDTQLVVDDGVKRTVLDVMKVNGNKMDGLTPLHVAVAEQMFRGLIPHASIGPRTRQESQIFLQKHWEAVNFSTSGLLAKRTRGVCVAPVGAVLGRAYYYEDRSALQQFIQVLVEGLSTDERDRTAMKLRDWLITRPNLGGGRNTALFAKVMKAVYDHFHNKPLGRSMLPATQDLYPLKARA